MRNLALGLLAAVQSACRRKRHGRPSCGAPGPALTLSPFPDHQKIVSPESARQLPGRARQNKVSHGQERCRRLAPRLPPLARLCSPFFSSTSVEDPVEQLPVLSSHATGADTKLSAAVLPLSGLEEADGDEGGDNEEAADLAVSQAAEAHEQAAEANVRPAETEPTAAQPAEAEPTAAQPTDAPRDAQPPASHEKEAPPATPAAPAARQRQLPRAPAPPPRRQLPKPGPEPAEDLYLAPVVLGLRPLQKNSETRQLLGGADAEAPTPSTVRQATGYERLPDDNASDVFAWARGKDPQLQPGVSPPLWLHGPHMTRAMAEAVLLRHGAADGLFLVRERQAPASVLPMQSRVDLPAEVLAPARAATQR